VPFIAWWPGQIKSGSVSDHISGFWDFLPTVCTLAGVTESYTSDGISLVPTLIGKGKQLQHDYIYFEFHEGNGSQAVRQGNWKAIVKGIKTRSPEPLELYDLNADPSESTNLASKYPNKAVELQAIMDKSHQPSNAFPFYVETEK
jgi:arylsulfatase A-like enzyme